MKRVLSGVRANSDLTLGNYLGAIRPWVLLQPHDDGSLNETEYFFFVPNLHSLSGRIDGDQLRGNTLSNVAWYLAAGLDPERVTLYIQSQIPAHAEMAWIFNNYVTMGELSRQTQYKDKLRKGKEEGQLVALFTYPALMAADILLYDADEVPVGDDQRQHVELARDIAHRFNNLYGPTFTLPRATHPDSGARIMNLQDPAKKMSKSDEDQSGTIMLTDSPDVIRAKIRKAATDSGNEVMADPTKPAINNLLEIFSALVSTPVAQLQNNYQGKGYGDFKHDLAEAAVAHLAPIQQRHAELMADQSKLLGILDDGRQKASAIASEKLSQVKQILGLL